MITLAITTYNRVDQTVCALLPAIDKDYISEIIIMDDRSSDENFIELQKILSFLSCDKIKVFRQDKNVGMSRNKRDAIERSTNDWVLILDSDNLMKSGIPISTTRLDGDTIYAPSYAWPEFDYSKYSGLTITKENCSEVAKDPIGNVLLNTCNYIVPRDEYLKVWEHNPEMKGTDTIYFNYLWLKSGRKIQVCHEFVYFHRVHTGSGFMADVDYNMRKAEEIRQLIINLNGNG